jgi:hypothetical protein
VSFTDPDEVVMEGPPITGLHSSHLYRLLLTRPRPVRLKHPALGSRPKPYFVRFLMTRSPGLAKPPDRFHKTSAQ